MSNLVGFKEAAEAPPTLRESRLAWLLPLLVHTETALPPATERVRLMPAPEWQGPLK